MSHFLCLALLDEHLHLLDTSSRPPTSNRACSVAFVLVNHLVGAL